MEKLNNKFDIEKYLQSGYLTQPFLNVQFVKEKVYCDFNHKKDQGKENTLLESLYHWIHHICKFAKGEPEFIKSQKFQRNAKEIFESKKLTGCIDYAILFATFARQLGIPTTFLHTAEYNWDMKMKRGEKLDRNIGHSFCECFYNDKWVLVDPTAQKIEWEYNPDELTLSYELGGSKKFLPYYRGLDLGKKQNIKQHNDEMDSECMKLF